jgi:hypothetical protein
LLELERLGALDLVVLLVADDEAADDAGVLDLAAGRDGLALHDRGGDEPAEQLEVVGLRRRLRRGWGKRRHDGHEPVAERDPVRCVGGHAR